MGGSSTGFRTNRPKPRLKLEAAPSNTKDELEAFGAGDQGSRERLFSYYEQYGAMPYW